MVLTALRAYTAPVPPLITPTPELRPYLAGMPPPSWRTLTLWRRLSSAHLTPAPLPSSQRPARLLRRPDLLPRQVRRHALVRPASPPSQDTAEMFRLGGGAPRLEEGIGQRLHPWPCAPRHEAFLCSQVTFSAPAADWAATRDASQEATAASISLADLTSRLPQGSVGFRCLCPVQEGKQLSSASGARVGGALLSTVSQVQRRRRRNSDAQAGPSTASPQSGLDRREQRQRSEVLVDETQATSRDR